MCDGDGRCDIFVTNFSQDHNTYYRNLGSGFFADVSGPVGLAGSSRPFMGWSTFFLDYDGDADLDLFVANGHLMPAIDAVAVGLSYAQTNQLYRNEGDGRYADISARAGPGFQLARVSRGAVYGDVDSDGDLDVVVANLDAAPSLLRNDSDYGHHWLVLQLSGPPGNQYGIGARVSIHVGGRILYRQVFSGDGFMGQHDPRLFVGLGQRRRADLVEVCWPSGVVQSFEDLAADRRYTIDHRDGLR